MLNMVIKETLNHMFTDPHQFNHILNVPLTYTFIHTSKYKKVKHWKCGELGSMLLTTISLIHYMYYLISKDVNVVYEKKWTLER